MNVRIPQYWLPTIPANKLLLGACIGRGCNVPAPTITQVIANAYNGSALYKGTMLWSATTDILYEGSTALKSMGSAGRYGVKMAFRALDA